MAALNAEVSVASKVKFKLLPSFVIVTFERFVNEVCVSGSNALNTDSNCSLDGNFKRTLAFARIWSFFTPLDTGLFWGQSPSFVEAA